MIPVAITQRILENDTYPETRDCLDVRWASFCEELGLLPIPLPTHFDPEPYFQRFMPSALILTGGNDLASVSNSPISRLRDEHEGKVLALALARNLPVLAVCRGMQLVAHTFGGAIGPVQGHTKGVSHPLAIDASTRFGRDLEKLEAVRSYHDYGVLSAPKDFTVVARANDGTIEAMEHASLPIYCQMWHPEREAKVSDGELAVFRRLFGTGKTPSSKQAKG